MKKYWEIVTKGREKARILLLDTKIVRKIQPERVKKIREFDSLLFEFEVVIFWSSSRSARSGGSSS